MAKKKTKRQPCDTASGSLVLQSIPIQKLKHAPYNPRKRLVPGDSEWQKIKRSIKTNGYIDPVVWNKRSGHIVGGHQRYAVLIAEFGVTAVDCVVVDMSPSQEKAANLALNKVVGEWDDAALAVVIRELQDDGTLRDLETGFEDDEIAKLLAAAASDMDDDPDTSEQLGDLQYQVIVDCTDEKHAAQVFQRLKKQGLQCKSLIL